MTTLQVTNSKGRAFTIRMVYQGDSYGLDNCLTHDETDPLVEFYDATYAGDDRFDPLGQFVTSYNARVLLGEWEYFGPRVPGQGLDLMGHEPVWKIDGDTMREVEAFIRRERKNG